LQHEFHPDKSSLADIEKSIAVNEGYEILRNPLRRAAHILQLHGIDVEKDGNALKPDMATLEEVMEIQEKAKAIEESDSAGLDLLQTVIRSAVEGASDLADEDFQTFPMDELSKLSNEIMKFSGIGSESGK